MADDTTTSTTSDDTSTAGTGASDETTPSLGDAGKRALAEERAARKKAERDARTTKEELDRIRAEGQSEAEKAIAKAKAEGSAEALAVANKRVLKAEIKAIAGQRLVDPSDAVRLLDLDDFAVDDDGNVDEAAITKAIDRLIKDKPYLAGETKRTTGSADGGARGGTRSPADMNAWLRGESRLPA